jgi:hypothetical protein
VLLRSFRVGVPALFSAFIITTETAFSFATSISSLSNQLK